MGYYKGFEQFSKTKYAKIVKDVPFIEEFMIGNYHSEGGCKYEFGIRFSKLDGKIVAVVEVFGDALIAFSEFNDLFLRLSEEKSLTIDIVYKILVELGFKDIAANSS